MTMLQELVLQRLLNAPDGLTVARLASMTGFAADRVATALVGLRERGYVIEDVAVWHPVRHTESAA